MGQESRSLGKQIRANNTETNSDSSCSTLVQMTEPRVRNRQSLNIIGKSVYSFAFSPYSQLTVAKASKDRLRNFSLRRHVCFDGEAKACRHIIV